jgi:hypothetical protein
MIGLIPLSWHLVISKEAGKQGSASSCSSRELELEIPFTQRWGWVRLESNNTGMCLG